MDFHTLISSGLDQTLRCFVCKNFLSYFPISLCCNNQSLCGRCAVPEGLISFQEEALETICQFIKFACRYQSDGCLEELAPRDMPEHEKNCSFRTVQCIISKPEQCNWKGSLPSLLPHCRTEHSDLILKNGEFQMDLSVSDKCDNLLEHNDDLLIFTRSFDSTSGRLNCALYNHEYAANTATCSAQLSVKNGNRTLLLDLKANGFTEVIFTELSLHSIRSEDKQDSLLCQINMNTQVEKQRLEYVRTSATILSGLKCSICSEFAVPPIYLCMKNVDTVCSVCSHKHQRSCNICSKNTIFRKSNVVLDKFAELAEYPCKNQKNGCTSTFRSCQIERHYNACEYGNVHCLFYESAGCEWEGLSRDINDHLLISHRELVMHSSDELELSEGDKNTNYKLIQFSNHLFVLAYGILNTNFAWLVQTTGSCTKKCWYEIDIVDGSYSGKRMLTRKCCYEVKTSETVDYIYFDKKQISDFLMLKNNVPVVKFRVKLFG